MSLASGTIDNLSGKTLTLATGTVSESDFDTQRLMALFDSADEFKGIAYVRRYVSDVSVDLESEFFDPVTNTAVAVAQGDGWNLSQTIQEAGLSNGGNVGTANDHRSVCVYAEEQELTVGNAFELFGGVFVLGHLADFRNGVIQSSCQIRFSTGGVRLRTRTTAAHFVMYGGSMFADSTPAYVGGYQGSAGGTLLFDSVESNCDMLSVGAGGVWGSNADRHILRNCSLSAAGVSAILVRWGDGVVSGGVYRLRGDKSISVFGADSGSNFAFGAQPGERLRCLEIGTGNQFLWRSYGAGSYLIDWTNVVTANRRHTGSNKGTFIYRDLYKNVVANTLIKIIGVNTGNEEGSGTSAGGGDIAVSVTEAVVIGETEVVTESSWLWGAIAYDREIVSGVFALISVETIGGDAKDVKHGATLIQAEDTLITDSRANVAAYTAIDTAAQFYDAAKNYLIDHYRAESQTLVSRLDDAIDAGSYNVNIDPNATDAFTVSGTTITIKSSAYTGLIQTTGVVTLLNGATQTGGIIDANGNSYLSFEGVASWEVFSDAARSGSLGTGTGSENFRFIFAENTVYYVDVFVSGEKIEKTITPATTGETQITLSTASLLSSLSVKIEETRVAAKQAVALSI